MQTTRSGPEALRQSRHLTAFAHLGAVYLYHDLFGYILQMSEDVLGFLRAFGDGTDVAKVCADYADAFEGQPPESFVQTFAQMGCLVPPDADEIEGIEGMVPVKSRWNVWERTEDGGVIIYTAWGDAPVRTHQLTPAEARAWDAFDGESPLGRRMREAHPEVDLTELIMQLVHHDIQALKLSAVPRAFYKGRRDREPPYLTSTMPYALYHAGAAGASDAADGKLSLTGYYRDRVEDARAQFDHQETTLAHLLRRSHPALRGRSYGAALVDALGERGLSLEGRIRVLEVGAGLGYVARAVIEALRARGLEVDYRIIELSPALAAAQRERCAGLPVTVTEADALTADLEEGAFDLFIANEMIGDLPAVEVTRGEVGIGLEPDEQRKALEAAGEGGRVIAEYGLFVDDAPPSFYLTVGAFDLVRRAFYALAPGGVGVVTEFGEPGRYPTLTTHMDHPELSIHFGHLQSAAERVGFEAEFEFVIDLLDFDRSLEGLATTRSYYRALEALLGEHGVKLEKIGYTREMLGDLVAGKLDLDRFGDLRFERIEDRLMGLVPHEFKALILRKPG